MARSDETEAVRRLFDGRYRILRTLGRGGMARVFLAEDESLHRKVAIKVLAERYAEDEQFIERFQREARSAAGLNHPNIVQIYDRGQAEGTYYIAMEYLEGENLKELITREGPLPARRAIDLTLQILAALRNSHRANVIHRDVKPHNIMVLADGRVKVTDFGIARAGVSEMTEAGSIIGTAQYLSPEQARGLPVGPASDLYSAGVVLYEMVTGRVPFDGDSAVAVAMRHVQEPPRPPSQLNADVPPALERVILRALGKSPDRRYATADEMGVDLDRVRKGLAPIAGGVPVAAADGRTRRLPVGETVVAPRPSSPRAAPAPIYEDAPDDEPPRRVWPWLLLLLLVLAAGGALAYALLGDGGDRTATGTATTATTAATTTAPEVVTMPALGGRRVGVARRQLEALGLRVQIEERFEARPAGTVIGQSVRAGTEVERGSAVTLRVSKGPQPVPVPGVVGSPRAAAESALTEAGFVVRVQEAPSDDVPAGSVISQEPAAAAQAKRGDTVTIVVSTGRQQAEVPSVIGLPEVEARAAIRNAGLVVERTLTPSDTVERGLVIESNPGPGTAVDPGSTVTIIVSSGPERATVPDVRGQTQEAAIAAIQAAGLTPQIEEVPVTDPAADNLVSQQNPPAGTAVEQGADVAIVVGRLAAAETAG